MRKGSILADESGQYEETTHESKSFSFLALPPEIRNMVYTYYMPIPPKVVFRGREQDVVLRINRHGKLVVPGMSFSIYSAQVLIYSLVLNKHVRTIALTVTSKHMYHETHGFIHTTAVLSQPGIIHAQIIPYDLRPLTTCLQIMVAEHNISLLALHNRVHITVIGPPVLGAMLQHFQSHRKGKCCLDVHPRAYCICDVLETSRYGDCVSVHPIVRVYTSLRCKAERRAWKKLAETFSEKAEKYSACIDVEIPEPEYTGNRHPDYKHDNMYPLLERVFDKVVGILKVTTPKDRKEFAVGWGDLSLDWRCLLFEILEFNAECMALERRRARRRS